MNSKIDPNAIRKGNRLALSRGLTAVENNQPEGGAVQSALFPYTGHAHLIGITGAPGTGKSTLVGQLAKSLRKKIINGAQPRIAIIAVDPTSPFSGGALLGDRIRMQDLAGDKEIFIRSMASRGALGGLAHSTAAFATLLDGAGFDLILIETVGAGQAEVDIAQLAHTVIVVEAPGLGDEIQAIKAGILEIADILVVNKADRPGAENTALALQAMLEMASPGRGSMATAGKHLRQLSQNLEHATQEAAGEPGWKTPVQLVTAINAEGIEDLTTNILRHKSYLEDSGMWQEKEAFRLRKDMEALIRDTLIQRWQETLDESRFESILADVIQRKYPPVEAINALLSSDK